MYRERILNLHTDVRVLIVTVSWVPQGLEVLVKWVNLLKQCEEISRKDVHVYVLFKKKWHDNKNLKLI